VVAFSLSRRDPELCGNGVAFVQVHGYPPAKFSARRSAETRHCSPVKLFEPFRITVTIQIGDRSGNLVFCVIEEWPTGEVEHLSVRE
jgi:hypothetical protein